jgi:hypothetical protein
MRSDIVHTYNSPGFGAHEFMLAVMHEPTVDLGLRMYAAERLCHAGLGDIGVVRVHKIIIDAGYVPTPEEWQEVQLLHRIWASGHTLTSLAYFDNWEPGQSGYLLADMRTKGNA